jgi:hypothetical protein
MKFKGIWPNSLRKRTGNLKTHNREFFFSNREFEKLEYGIFFSELGIDLAAAAAARSVTLVRMIEESPLHTRGAAIAESPPERGWA